MTIRRTMLEWSKLPYGDAPEDPRTIPEPAADRLAAVASGSALAKQGDGVLYHGRKSLQSKGIVGVVAADGAVLEILPKIDVPHTNGQDDNAAIRKHLVRMLAVALNVQIDVGALTELHWQRDTLLDILIRIFCEKLEEAVRRGRPRLYVRQEDDLPALRGRLDVTRQFTVHAANPSRLACRFDELSEDIPLNRIMKAAVVYLRKATRNSGLARRLQELSFVYGDVSDCPVSMLPWDQVQLDRTNRRWQGLLEMARLFLTSRYQTTTSGRGSGFCLLFEMSALFEDYVGRRLHRELQGSGLNVSLQGGRLFCLEHADTGKGRFQTRPDILIRRGREVVHILDTKWKRISPAASEPTHGVSQADVYQMMAYAQLYHCPKVTLLYPHHFGLGEASGLQTSFRISENVSRIEVATVDLLDRKSGQLAALMAVGNASVSEMAEA